MIALDALLDRYPIGVLLVVAATALIVIVAFAFLADVLIGRGEGNQEDPDAEACPAALSVRARRPVDALSGGPHVDGVPGLRPREPRDLDHRATHLLDTVASRRN